MRLIIELDGIEYDVEMELIRYRRDFDDLHKEWEIKRDETWDEAEEPSIDGEWWIKIQIYYTAG